MENFHRREKGKYAMDKEVLNDLGISEEYFKGLTLSSKMQIMRLMELRKIRERLEKMDDL